MLVQPSKYAVAVRSGGGDAGGPNSGGRDAGRDEHHPAHHEGAGAEGVVPNQWRFCFHVNRVANANVCAFALGLCSSACVVATAVVVPYLVAYGHSANDGPSSALLTADVVWISLVAINSWAQRCKYTVAMGVLLVLDVVTGIPWLHMLGHDEHFSLWYVLLASLPLWRLRIFVGQSSFTDDTTSNAHLQILTDPSRCRLITIPAGLFFLANYFAAVMVGITSVHAAASGNFNMTSPAPTDAAPVTLFTYVQALHISTQTLFTVGYGEFDVSSDSLTVVLVLQICCGAWVYALLIAGFTSMASASAMLSGVSRLSRDTYRYLQHVDALPDTKRRVLNYVRLSAAQYGRLSEREIINCLPPGLLRKAYAMRLRTLSHAQLFTLLSNDLRLRLASLMCSQTYMAGEHILHKERLNASMHIITSGSAWAVATDGDKQRIVCSFTANDQVGLYELLFRGRYAMHDCDIVACSVCSTLMLSQEHVENVITDDGELLTALRDLKASSTNSLDLPGDQPVNTSGMRRRKQIHMELLSLIHEHELLTVHIHDPTYAAPDIDNANDTATDHIHCCERCSVPRSAKLNAFVVGLHALWSSCAAPARAAYLRLDSHRVDNPGYLAVDIVLDLLLACTIVQACIPRRQCFIVWSAQALQTLLGIVFPASWALVRLPFVPAILISTGSVLRKQVFRGDTTKWTLAVVSGLVLLLVHWMACLWWAMESLGPRGSSFTSCLYFMVMTVTTTGYGDILPASETGLLFNVANIFVSCYAFAFLVACLSSLHSGKTSPRNAKYRAEVLSKFCESFQASDNLAARIARYDQWVSQQLGDVDAEFITSRLLPERLQQQVTSEIRIAALQGCVPLSSTSYACKQILARAMVAEVAGPGQWVCRKGEVAPGMFIIERGTVELSCTESGEMTLLTKRDSFAHQSLLSVENFCCNIRPIEVTQFWILRREMFLDEIRGMPSLRDTIRSCLQATRFVAQEVKVVDIGDDETVSLPSSATRMHGRASMGAPTANFRVCRRLMYLGARCFTTFVILQPAFYLYAIPFCAVFMLKWQLRPWHVAYDLVAYLFHGIRLARQGKTRPRPCRMLSFLQWAHMIPFELLAPLFASATVGSLQVFAVLLLPKLLRLPLLRSKAIAGVDRKWRPLKLSCTETRGHCKTLAMLLGLFLTASHIFACCWFAVGTSYGTAISGPSWSAGTPCALSNASVSCASTSGVPSAKMTSWYLRSLYFVVISLTTVGYGDVRPTNDPERMLSILIMMSGVFILVHLLGKLEKIVANVDVASTLYHTKVDMFRDYAQSRGLPLKLQVRANDYFEYLWKHHGGATFDEILSYMNDADVRELIDISTTRVLRLVPVFPEFPPEMLKLVQSELQIEILLQSQILFVADEVSDPFYVLHDGVLELLEGDITGPKKRRHRRTVYATLEGPAAVCTETFFMREPRPCTARGRSTCLLFSVEYARVLQHMHAFPQHYDRYKGNQRVIEARLQKMSLVKTMKKNLSSSRKLLKLQMQGLSTTSTLSSSQLIFDHSSPFRLLWTLFVAAAVFAELVAYPYRLASGFKLTAVAPGIIVNLTFAIHVYLNAARFVVITSEGNELKSRSKIWGHYRRSWRMPTHIILSLPFEAVCAFALHLDTGPELRMARAPMLLCIAAMGKIMPEVNTLLKVRGVRTEGGLYRAVKNVAAILLVTHWVACAFKMLDISAISYLDAQLWAIYTMTTIGFGNVALHHEWQRVLAMAASVLGSVLCGAGLTAILTYWIKSLDSKHSKIKIETDAALRYGQAHGWSREVLQMARKYFGHKRDKMRCVTEAEISAILSPALRTDVQFHYALQAMKRLGARLQWPAGLAASLARRSSQVVIMPGECVVKAGEANGLFVIVAGTATKTPRGGSPKPVAEGVVVGGISGQDVAYSVVATTHVSCAHVPTRVFEQANAFYKGARKTRQLDVTGEQGVLHDPRPNSILGQRQRGLLSSLMQSQAA